MIKLNVLFCTAVVSMVFIHNHAVIAKEYLVLRENLQHIPGLGDGFDPTYRLANAVRQKALKFEDVDLRKGAVTSDVQVFELSSQLTQSRLFNANLDFDFPSYVKGKFGASQDMDFYEKHTIFIASVFATAASHSVRNPKILESVDVRNKDAFRRNHGVQYVSGIDYGGYVILIYKFRKLDNKSTEKLSMSLQSSFVTGASLDDTMKKNAIVESYAMQSLQHGGSIEPFLEPSLAGLKQYLTRWIPTLQQSGVPVAIHIQNYSSVVGFPFAWPDLGFGQTRIGSNENGGTKSLQSTSKPFSVEFKLGEIREELPKAPLALNLVQTPNNPPGFGKTITRPDDSGVKGNGSNYATWSGRSTLSYRRSLDPDFRTPAPSSIPTLALVGGIDPEGRAIPPDSKDRANLWEMPLYRGKFAVSIDKTPMQYLKGYHPYSVIVFSIAVDRRENTKYILEYTGTPNTTVCRLLMKDTNAGIPVYQDRVKLFPYYEGFKIVQDSTVVNGNKIDGGLPPCDNKLILDVDAPDGISRTYFFQRSAKELKFRRFPITPFQLGQQ